ncbi:glutamine amidotransferase [Actinomadura fulvescens]|uniref:Lipid II isoglutaminyl synthase (glutamine-hydrolyzing) subunit GatD n=1 Tax=Actinomadura fulvescens TaxID=46160 RepID=A0ABN3Q4R3_9ACTN
MSSNRPLKLVWIYPDLLSTYGDQGNTIVLERRAALRGIPTETVHMRSDEPVPTDGDIYLLGGGEDRPQILAAQRLRNDGGLRVAAEGGAVIFGVCAGFQILGHEFGGEEGQLVPGLGLLDIRSFRGEQRAVGEVVGDVATELNVPRITGFENHQGATQIGPNARPLARVVAGIGNGGGDGTEGAYAGRILGTYMHGPALVRNPGLADLLLRWAVGAELQPIDDSWAGRLREERLNAVLTSG